MKLFKLGLILTLAVPFLCFSEEAPEEKPLMLLAELTKSIQDECAKASESMGEWQSCVGMIRDHHRAIMVLTHCFKLTEEKDDWDTCLDKHRRMSDVY